MKSMQNYLMAALILSGLGAYGVDEDVGGGDNDGLNSKNKVAPLLSKADPEVAERMPPELKNIRLEHDYIEVMSDDYEMGDWQESPSKIIFHNGMYHMWIIDIPQGSVPTAGTGKTKKVESVTTYMNSKNGKLWFDRGKLPLGKAGTIDDAERLAPDVIKHDGRFYLFYEPMTSNAKDYRQRRCGIAALVAEQPEGPWTYAHEGLLLVPEIDDPEAWDHLFVANPRIEYFNGKWFMYYKGKGLASTKTLNGVATSDNLLGPYTKYKGNPLMGGHSANLVKYKNGLIYMNYHKHAFYWTEDGFTFTLIKKFGRGSGMAEDMNWSSFWLPNNPLYGGDPSRPDATELWGVSSRWAYQSEGYRKDVNNNDIIGAKLVIGAE
ncbi:hypothetical protein PDESU_05482 [Pontiella desulfatans]|uniref:Glycosyl hydrolase family 43 n=1 Tax=Pontiella desulfatans TaxID=2750659 RepID=A0A6C2UA23_PONDE|nr:family 43 glycosylhydrolase [Pontiella desulfatans]VGO16890.1 hypothetical protein PDESU_05482 [Pontiella desulfatans]